MTGGTDDGFEIRILESNPAHRRVQDALRDLFAGDGTVYLVAGFFTFNGYRSLREDITGFLDRSTENRLHVVVGASSDQFSPRIATDLWSLDDHDQVTISQFNRGLHAKLYLRDGPNPHAIVGSANLTQVGFRYNVELGVEILASTSNHRQIEPFVDWVSDLVADAEPVRKRDLLFPVQLWNAARNWGNKGRLLPPRYVAKRLAPLLLLGVMVGGAVWVI